MTVEKLANRPDASEVPVAIVTTDPGHQSTDATRAAETLEAGIDLKSMLLASEAARLQAETRLSERFCEIAIISDLLRQETRQSARHQQNSEWLAQISAILIGVPWWWALVPGNYARRKLRARLARKGLFDAQAYVARYPDVAAAGMDPLAHFIRHGLRENRSYR